jgi:hypothetical protein
MAKLKIAITALALVAMAALIGWQQQRAKRLAAEAAVLREQVASAASLREENQRLAEQMRVATERTQADQRELLRLRGQAGTLRQTEQENARLKTERDRLVKQLAQPGAGQSKETESQETPERKLMRAKSVFGLRLGYALIVMAEENGGRFPDKLPGAVAELLELIGAEQEIRPQHFELVYKGSWREANVMDRTILAREKVPFQLADGRWGRIYVFGDGHTETVGADTPDGFAAVEKERGLWSGESNP